MTFMTNDLRDIIANCTSLEKVEPKSCFTTLNVKYGLQNRTFTRKSLFDWKIMRNFAALNIKKMKINDINDK